VLFCSELEAYGEQHHQTSSPDSPEESEKSGDAIIAALSKTPSPYGRGSDPMNVPQLVYLSRFFFEIYSVAIQTAPLSTATAAK